jgi:hypothetical protein
MFEQILAGSFVPVTGALAIVHAECATILERMTTLVPDDQKVAAILSQVAVPLPTQPTGCIANLAQSQ